MANSIRKNIALKDDYIAQPAQALVLSASAGVVDLSTPVTTFDVTGTCTATMAAPLFSGQEKLLVIIAGASTPLLTITVTGCRIATQDAWAMGTFVAASAPRSVRFVSYDGLVWDPVSTVGTVTVS